MITTFQESDFALEFDKRKLTKEYLESVLKRVKEHLPHWLYKQIHQVAMSSAGGRARWRRQKGDEVSIEGVISKVDEDRQMVFGWASVVEEGGKVVTDRQGDRISEADMEHMAYQFALNYRDAGEMHQRVGVGKLIETMAFTKEKQEALGIDLGRVAWWVGFKVTDTEVWKKIKDGDYTAFSIHGYGQREEVAA